MSYPAQTTGRNIPAQILVQGNALPLSNIPGKNNVTLSLSGTNGPTSFQLNPVLADVADVPVSLGTQLVLSAVAAATPAALVLTSAATSAGATNYVGTITGGASNGLVGKEFTVAGFTNAVNNGTFICTASSSSSLVLSNPNGVAETHAATAQDQSAVAVYTGTITGGGSNAFVGETFVIAGFTNASNNGSFICTASTTTTLTLANPNTVAETHAGTATLEEVGTLALTYYVDGARNSAATPPNGAAGSPVVTVSPTGLISTNGVKGGTVVEVSYPAFNNTSGTTGAVSPNPMTGLPKNKIYAEVNVRVVA